MDSMKKAEVRLKVMEAVQDDVNRGIVKTDSAFLKEIGAAPGDIVEIQGERRTAAIVDRAYPGDIGLNIIRMDGNTRRNAKTSIGEMVTVTKADVKPAKKVSIAPAHKGVLVKASPQLFKQGLLGKALVKGDIVSLGRRRARFDLQTQDMNDIFSMMESQFASFGLGDLKFIVVDTNPKKEIVIINRETEIEFLPQAVDYEEDESVSLGVNYEDIGGLSEEIKKVREMVELPLKHPEVFQALGIEAPKGVLLHGPPGTGKTLLAKAVASETNSHFILINGPEIISKFYGESEQNLRKKFEEAEKNAPSIIFFDEIDAIATKREEARGDVEKRVVAQLLSLMDGLKSRGKVIVIAATNMPNLLDPALRRPGRFDREIELGVPRQEGRLEILKIHTRHMPLIANDIYPDILKSKFIQNMGSLHDKCDSGIQKLNTESEMLNKEKNDHQLELADLKIQQKKAEGSLLYSVVNRIKGLETLIDKKKEDILNIDEKKKECLVRLDNIKKIKQELDEDKKKIILIINELIKIYNDRKLYSIDDPRRKISDNALNNILDPKMRSLMQLISENGLNFDELVKQCLMDKEAIGRDLKEISRITHGFVGADLSALAKEAAMIVLRRILPELKKKVVEEDQPIPKEILQKIVIDKKDFFESLKIVRPSAMREVMVETPDVSWEDIGGLEDIKGKLKEAVELPIKNPEVFKRLGIRPPRGILLYGAPGTGKTMLAKAVAKESEANFILINGPSLLSKWVGESEKAVREIFRKARQTAPTILFFDEIDSLVPRRNIEHSDSGVTERVVNQMLTEIDGLESLNDVVIIGATNRPDMVDPALLRQGRFDRIILTTVPDTEGRKKIFIVHMQGMPLAKDVDADKLAKKTKGYVGSDIEGVCREAAMIALREDINVKEIKAKHFEAALEIVKPSVTEEIEELYNKYGEYFSTARAKRIKEDKAAYFG